MLLGNTLIRSGGTDQSGDTARQAGDQSGDTGRKPGDQSGDTGNQPADPIGDIAMCPTLMKCVTLDGSFCLDVGVGY